MKSLKKQRLTFSLGLIVLLIPSIANACAMSGLGGMYGSGLLELFIIAIIIFLMGYLPYLFLSIRVAIQATKGTLSKRTKIWASIFALINTITFVTLVTIVVTEFGPILFSIDLLLWGVPMFFFIKGMLHKTSSISA